MADIIQNNALNSQAIQQQNGPNTGQPYGPQVPDGPATPIKAAPTPTDNTQTQTFSFLDGSSYNAQGQQVKAPTVVSAKDATLDLANKQNDLTNTNNAMSAQAATVAANNAKNLTAAAAPKTITSSDIQAANTPEDTEIQKSIKQIQQLGFQTPEAIASYANSHDVGLPAGTNLTADMVKNILNPAVEKTPAQQQAENDSKQQATYDNFQNQISQLQNGTFPLTPDQQSQVNALQSQFEQLKQQQQLANQNYTGGVTNAGIAAGRNRYAPEIELGNIQASVSAGIQKIAAIDSQAAQAISQLKQGFMDNDYKLINAAYTAASDLFKQKSDTLFKLSDSVRADAQAALDQHKSNMADQQQEYDRQQAAIKFATDYGVTKPFYLVGNTAVNTATGEKVDLAEYQRLTGQKVGLPESQTDFSSIQTDVQPPGKFSSVTATDAFGNQVVGSFNTKTGQVTYGPASPSTSIPTSPATGADTGTGPQKLSFDQYGLLANTDFNPDDTVDALAQKYLDSYIKNGTVPTASTLGRGIKPEAMAQIDQRARDLYYKATGSALPTPEILKGYQQLIINNNKLSNNLKIQEQTVKANVDLSLDNIKKNDLNSIGFKPLDNFINTINDMVNDPNVGQLIAQNSTIQNELGSLLAVKNASGTTVYDKLTSAGIITRNDSPEQITAKVNTLLTEATNFADSINSANSDAYKYTDPLLQDPNNPLRQQQKEQNPTTIPDYISSHPEQANIAKQMVQDHPGWSEEDIIQGLNALGGLTTKTPVDINKAIGSGGLSLNSEGSGSSNARPVSINLGSHLATVNNNPGNLRFVGQAGATQGSRGFAKFSTPQAGVQALAAQIKLDASRGHTLASFINKYAPPSENDTKTYIQQLASRLGVSSSTPISKINISSLVKEIAKKESSSIISFA